jgi:DNA mismatch repair protein MutS
MAQLTPMMQQYMKIKEEYSDCILLFRLGDFYEMFFDDAQTVSEELDLVLTGRDCGLEERAPMCGVPYHAVDSYVNRLLQNNHKVAICDQLEDPAQAHGMVKRGVTRVITPGTVTEPAMLSETENSYILSIAHENDPHTTGICYADVSTGEFIAYEFKGNDASLQGEIARIAPKEMIFSQNQETWIQSVLKDPRLKNIYLNSYFDWAYEREAAQKALEDHFKTKGLNAYGISDQPSAIRAAGALMNYLVETQKNSLAHINTIKVPAIDDTLVIDSTAARNLEITQTIMDGSKKGSLLWLLDKTKTSLGARLLKRILLRPLRDMGQINARLDAVGELKENLSFMQDVQEELSGIYDLERLLARISYASLNARDCNSLRHSLSRLPRIRNLLTRTDIPLLQNLYNDIDPLSDIHELLSSSISEDPPSGLRDGNIIKEGYNEEADRLRKASREGKQWLLQLEAKEKELTGIKNLKIGYNKVFGYFLEVTKSYQNLVPYRYIRKQTLANCERYITEELKEMEETILNAEEKLCHLEYGIFLEIRTHLEKSVPRIQKTAHAVAMLDVLQSLGSVAYEFGYNRPQILKNGKIYLKDGRHPVIEKIMKQNFVPNDVTLDMKENNLLLITGPNMAGKSTYMRQVGLIAIMAHIGSFVPASIARISLLDRIFTRVGASDDLASGQSTFMVEMNELANILNNATENSLIILDEIGRGTSTIDGLSIAWATVEYLLSHIRAKTLFATHFHELIELENQYPGIKNYSIAVREFGHEIIFLHKIIKGGTDKSFGVEVARLAGLPKELTSNAKKMLLRLNKNEPSILENHNAESNKDVAFPESHQSILKRIKKTDINALTPLEALNMLSLFSEELRNE